MEAIKEVKPLEGYFIWVLFSDNFTATIDIKPFISTGISAKLSDYEYFKNVKVDEFGGITWENGFDFCPNYLRELTEKQRTVFANYSDRD
jgi:hypothetical protein